MENEKKFTGPAYEFEAKMPLKQAIPLGLQHVLAMFVGNLTPLLIITGACGITGGNDLAQLQIELLQNAMLVAGLITLLQLFSVGPVGGKVPIIMGTSSGFIGVFNSVAATIGRRYFSVRRHYGCFDHRRSVRECAWMLLKAASPTFSHRS
mgnify:CR=1 FL=1